MAMKYMIFRILHFVIPLVAYYLVQFIIIYGAKFEDGAEMILDIAYWILVCIVIIGYVNLIRNYKIQTLRLPVVFYLVSQATYFVSHFVYRNDKDGDDKDGEDADGEGAEGAAEEEEEEEEDPYDPEITFGELMSVLDINNRFVY